MRNKRLQSFRIHLLLALAFCLQSPDLQAELPHKGVVVWCEDFEGLCRWFPDRPEQTFWKADDPEQYREFREFSEGWVVLQKHIHPYYGSLLVLDRDGETVLQLNLPMAGPLRAVTAELPDGSLLLCNNSERHEEGIICSVILSSRGASSVLFDEGKCAFPSFNPGGRFTCVREGERLEIVSGLYPSLSRADSSKKKSHLLDVEHHGIGAFEMVVDGEYIFSDGMTVWYWQEGKDPIVLEAEEPRWIRRENGRVFLAQCEYLEDEMEDLSCSVGRVVPGGKIEPIWTSSEFQPGYLYGLDDGNFLLEVMTEEKREDLLVLSLSARAQPGNSAATGKCLKTPQPPVEPPLPPAAAAAPDAGRSTPYRR